MDDKKFITQLGIEPRNRDPQFLEASRASLKHARAYADAQEFEDKLEAALKLNADPALVESILERLPSQAQPDQHKRFAGWIALAASVLVLIGAASFFLPTRGADAVVRDAFITHLNHPEPALTARQAVSDERLLARFASRGVDLRKPLSDVSYLSPCVIGDTPGLHLVMTDEQDRQITFMLMPGHAMEENHNFSMGEMTVRMSHTSGGAVALFGHQGQDLGGPMRDLLRNIDGPMRRVAAL